MNRTMISAAVSLNALQQKLDMIANNVANLNTAGYKRQEASFQDVLTSVLEQHPDTQLPGRHSPHGLTVGHGARLSGLRLDLSQGTLIETDNPLDLAIEGRALFEVEVPLLDADGNPVFDEDGQVMQTLWTRSGQFQLSVMEDLEGYVVLTTSEGYPVRSADDGYIMIPAHADFQIDAAGNVTYTDVDGAIVEAGQIKLMRIMRPELITAVGSNLYDVAANVQDADNVLQQVDDPAGEGIAVRQYRAEQSNVDLATELTELIMVQRAYQLNARALIAGDTMMSLANQLRR